MHTGFGQELYPTVVEKAAALVHGFARTQPFDNANKRTAWTCCVVYLQQHDLAISTEVTQDNVVEFVLSISVGAIDVPEVALQLLEWLE
jgi:death-on-curing protein